MIAVAAAQDWRRVVDELLLDKSIPLEKFREKFFAVFPNGVIENIFEKASPTENVIVLSVPAGEHDLLRAFYIEFSNMVDSDLTQEPSSFSGSHD